MIYLIQLLNWEIFQAHLGIGEALSSLSSGEAALARPNAVGGDGPRESRKAPGDLMLFVPAARAPGFDKTLLLGDGAPR